MACDCSPSDKQTYYAHVQLHTHLVDGIPGGSTSPMGAVKEVTVCSKCGSAEFVIPESERRWFERT